MNQTSTMPVGSSGPHRLRAAVSGTPGMLRVAGTLTAIAALVFGALGWAAVSSRSSDISTISAESAQLVRLQDVRTNLVAADAAATNAFLVGGLEPPAARKAYQTGINGASRSLAEAASHASPADATALGKVNEALTTYSGLIESARASNRQGFPVGVAYLKQASALLRADVLPELAASTNGVHERVRAASAKSVTAVNPLWAGAAAVLVAFIVGQAVLAVRARRLLSIPLVGAAVLVIALTAVAGSTMAYAQWKSNQVQSGPYAQVANLAQARIDAFDAKSAESLTLISRGSGEAFEERFATTAASSGQAIGRVGGGPALQGALARYLSVHREVRKLDDGGQWDDAVALATSTAPKGSNAAFTAFDAATRVRLDTEASHIEGDLASARAPLGAVRIAIAIAALLAAAAAWQAFAIRLREYR